MHPIILLSSHRNGCRDTSPLATTAIITPLESRSHHQWSLSHLPEEYHSTDSKPCSIPNTNSSPIKCPTCLYSIWKNVNKNKEKGWLNNRVQGEETMNKVLTTITKNLLLVVYPLFLGLPNEGATFGCMAALAKKFDLSNTRIVQISQEFIKRDFVSERKVRSDTN